MTLPPPPPPPPPPRLHHRRLRLPDILRPLDLVAEDGFLPLHPLPPSRPSPQAPSPLSRFSGRETPMDRLQASWSTLTPRSRRQGGRWTLTRFCRAEDFCGRIRSVRAMERRDSSTWDRL